MKKTAIMDMKTDRFLAKIILLALLIGGAVGRVAAQETRQLSVEAERLLKLLHYIDGEKTLSGTVANVNWNFNEAKWVQQHTGKWPALNCMDYIHHPFASKGGWIDYTNVAEVTNWHRQGGVLLIMWHWNVPANESGKYSFYYGEEADKTTFDVRKIFEPESEEYKLMLKDIDQIASYLKLLKARKIPVLWRPLHEAGGQWFWWGRDAEACNELWRVMYDRFTNHHKLDNLIWVWTQAAAWNKPYSDGYRWYPGDDYVDIVSIDVYNNNSAANIYSSCFRFLQRSSPSKLVALTECGNVPKFSAMWKARAKWLFFAPWYDYGRTNDPGSAEFKSTEHGSCDAAWWQDAFEQDYVLSREDFKLLQQDFVGISTILDSPTPESHRSGVYDLSGRPVANPSRGFYIINGKKVFVR